MRKDPTKLYNKVEAKANLKRYIILLVCFFPIILLLNFTIFAKLSSFLMIFLDVVLSLGFVFVGAVIWNNIAEKRKQKREEARKQREFEEKMASIQSFKAEPKANQKKKGKRRNRGGRANPQNSDTKTDTSLDEENKNIENKNEEIIVTIKENDDNSTQTESK